MTQKMKDVLSKIEHIKTIIESHLGEPEEFSTEGVNRVADKIEREGNPILAQCFRDLATQRDALAEILAAAIESDAEVKPLNMGALRKLVRAAFRIMDDAEDNDDSLVIDCDIAGGDLRRMSEALDELGIESHEDIDRVFGVVVAETNHKRDPNFVYRDQDDDDGGGD